MLGFKRVKPSPKQAPTAPPGQVHPASFIDVIFPFAAARTKGITQFLFWGDASSSQFAVVFPKNIPTGSNSKCSISTNFIFITNHSFEFKKVEDKVVMIDYMIENTDPQYVFFEMDVYWVMMGQASPVDYFNRYPGRFKLLHIKDRKEIGQSGMVGFDAIFKNAELAGVENIVVEVFQKGYTLGEKVIRPACVKVAN